MKYAPRRRRNSPPPIDYIMRELHASSKRCDELLGPALQMIDERRKLSERFTTGLLVVGVAIDPMRQLESQLMMRNYEGFIS